MVAAVAPTGHSTFALSHAVKVRPWSARVGVEAAGSFTTSFVSVYCPPLVPVSVASSPTPPRMLLAVYTLVAPGAMETCEIASVADLVTVVEFLTPAVTKFDAMLVTFVFVVRALTLGRSAVAMLMVPVAPCEILPEEFWKTKRRPTIVVGSTPLGNAALDAKVPLVNVVPLVL